VLKSISQLSFGEFESCPQYLQENVESGYSVGQYDREALSRHFSIFLSGLASTTAARWQVVLGVRPLMLALNSDSQLFMMLCGWTDDLFGFNNPVHSLEPKLINCFFVDHIANPDFAHARAKQFTDAAINFHVQLAGIANEYELPLGKPFQQSRDLFDLVIVGPAERTTNGIDQE